jgi:hypothetical protein
MAGGRYSTACGTVVADLRTHDIETVPVSAQAPEQAASISGTYIMPIQIVRKTKGGVDYIGTVLCQRKSVVTRAVFWRVPHLQTNKEDIRLKIGRYTKLGFNQETLQATNPKSELTLDDEEFRNLLQFISENYEPFRARETKYLPVDDSLDEKNLKQLRTIFRNPNKQQLLKFIVEHSILPDDLLLAVQNQQRIKTIGEFEGMLKADAREHEWQRWFSKNNWILGSEFVRVVDERNIDTEIIADYLVQAFDGFLDIIEIKRPGGGLRFWASSLDHGNYIPSNDLIKAVTQANAYIFELEREINSQKFIERVGGVRTVKPRCVLVFGRSHNWNDDERRAFRILNASYHNLSIMTYDHVLGRAKRIAGLPAKENAYVDDDDIPF